MAGRYYRMTPARRAALKKAQLASARKRRRSRNIKIGVVAAGTTAAVVGAGVWRHKASGSSLTMRKLHGPANNKVIAGVITGPRGINTETRLKYWGNSPRRGTTTVKKAVIGSSIPSQRKIPFGISVGRSAIRNAKPVVQGSKVWLSGDKVSHHRYHATIGGFGRGYEFTYTHSSYVPRSKRTADLGIPVVPKKFKQRGGDPTIPFYKGQRGNWPKGKINPDSPKNRKALKRSREAIYGYDVTVFKGEKKRKRRKK